MGKLQNGVEIEIIVRTRKEGKPVGKAGHVYVTAEGMKIGEAERRKIGLEAGQRVDDYMKSLVIGPAE